jgi:hypothetical protein
VRVRKDLHRVMRHAGLLGGDHVQNQYTHLSQGDHPATRFPRSLRSLAGSARQRCGQRSEVTHSVVSGAPGGITVPLIVSTFPSVTSSVGSSAG